MQILIHTMSDKKFVLENYNPNETVKSIKKRIQDVEKIPIEEQSLYVFGFNLQNHRTLGEFVRDPTEQPQLLLLPPH